jgi:hypothetical protein
MPFVDTGVSLVDAAGPSSGSDGFGRTIQEARHDAR